MGSIGFGKGITSGNVDGTGSYIMLDGRILLGDIEDDTHGFIFLRIENYKNDIDEAPGSIKSTQLCVGFGLL